MPGGCNFGGVRPIDQHVKGFSALGAGVTTEGGYINASWSLAVSPGPTSTWTWCP